MNAEQIRNIQTSFDQVLPRADTAAALFYYRLFQLDPSLRALFRGDMKAQGRKLMSTLKLAVLSLERLDDLIPGLMELGQRHASYGVKPEHFDTVASALLWTLEQMLGDQFMPEIRTAWVELYTVIAKVMKEAAHEVVSAGPWSQQPQMEMVL